jgi:hypothetical protein
LGLKKSQSLIQRNSATKCRKKCGAPIVLKFQALRISLSSKFEFQMDEPKGGKMIIKLSRKLYRMYVLDCV